MNQGSTLLGKESMEPANGSYYIIEDYIEGYYGYPLPTTTSKYQRVYHKKTVH